MDKELFDSYWTEGRVLDAFNRVLKRGAESPFGLTALELTRSVAFRVYDEWWLRIKSKDSSVSHMDYRGDALKQFLNDEILWESVDPKRGKNKIDYDFRLEEERVLNAFARSAIEFFSRHCKLIDGNPSERYTLVKSEDNANIRRSLQPWLDNPDAVYLLAPREK